MADNINDDFTDLTEDENAGKGKKKPAKKAPAPKAAQKAAAVPDKKDKSGKKKGGKLKIILIIVLVLLVAGFVFEEIYFNYLGMRDVLIDSVVKIDPEYGPRQVRLDEREADLDLREAGIEARERSVGSRETTVDRRAAELDQREETLSNNTQSSAPIYRRQLTAQEITDMESLSRSYSQMPPDAAAVILTELERMDDVAAILYYMNERNAASILSAMDPEFAARITEILLYS